MNIKLTAFLTHLKQGLAFLLKPRSLLGLLASNVLVLVTFALAFLYTPWAGMDAGGRILPISAEMIEGVLLLCAFGALLGVLIIAAPYIIYTHAKGRWDYNFFINGLLKWLVIICVACVLIAALKVGSLRGIIALFILLPSLWIPTWLAGSVYWLIAVKPQSATLSIKTRIFFLLIWCIWFLMALSLGAFLTVD